MDYIGILKKAYQITINNKFLWIFGIFAGGISGINSLSGSAPGYIFDRSDINQYSGTNAFLDNFDQFWSHYGTTILIMASLFLLIAIVFFILNVISQAALVGSAAQLDQEEKANFKLGFKIGWGQFWRVWAMMIIYLLMILFSLCLLIIPACFLVIINVYILAGVWFVLAFIVALVFWLFIAVISPYSLRIIVLEKKSVWESIRESLHFVRDHLAEVLIMYLLLIVINMVIGLILGLVVVLAASLLFVIGYGFWLASVILAVYYGVSVSLLFLFALIIIGGAYNSFYANVLTLTYIRLKK